MTGVGVFLLLLYFLPAIVAFSRGHNSAFAILVLTLLAGWTVVAWLVALVWSFTGNTRAATQRSIHVSVNQTVVAAPAALAGSPSPPPRESTPRLLAADAPALEMRPANVLRLHVSREGRRYWRNEAPPRPPGYLMLRGPHLDEIVVHGTSHYQQDLEAIVGGERDAPVFYRAIAFVYREPENPHDPHAVAVDIEGRRVGHIAAEDAEAFGRELQAIGGEGAFACRALIDNGKPTWFVRLDAFRPLEAD